MQAQRFDGTFELLFADGRSQDGTREILLELARQDPRIRVLDNPRRRHGERAERVPARGARRVRRADGRAHLLLRSLPRGRRRAAARGDTEWVSGPAVPRPAGLVSRAVALALGSWLGRGGSRKWDEDAAQASERELDSGVFGGVWRRSRVLAAGGWDERWPVNQDSEMAARFLLARRAPGVPARDGRPLRAARLAAARWRASTSATATTARARFAVIRRACAARTWSRPRCAACWSAPWLAPGPLRRAARLALALYLACVGARPARDVALRRGQRARGRDAARRAADDAPRLGPRHARRGAALRPAGRRAGAARAACSARAGARGGRGRAGCSRPRCTSGRADSAPGGLHRLRVPLRAAARRYGQRAFVVFLEALRPQRRPPGARRAPGPAPGALALSAGAGHRARRPAPLREPALAAVGRALAASSRWSSSGGCSTTSTPSGCSVPTRTRWRSRSSRSCAGGGCPRRAPGHAAHTCAAAARTAAGCI